MDYLTVSATPKTGKNTSQLLETVQDLDDGMQDKANVGEKAQQTGVFEHFESTFNAVMCPLARS